MATCGLLMAVLTGPLVNGAATRPIGSICGIGNLGKDGIGIGSAIGIGIGFGFGASCAANSSGVCLLVLPAKPAPVKSVTYWFVDGSNVAVRPNCFVAGFAAN